MRCAAAALEKKNLGSAEIISIKQINPSPNLVNTEEES